MSTEPSSLGALPQLRNPTAALDTRGYESPEGRCRAPRGAARPRWYERCAVRLTPAPDAGSLPDPLGASSLLGLFLLLVGVCANHDAKAQVVRDDFYVADGPVRAAVLSNDVLYIGGSFGHVGPATGGGAAIDSVTGLVLTGMPKVAGRVLAVAPDGLGGWYIGGRFSAVGQLAINNLAHLRPDRSVSGWNPAPNDTVRTLALAGGTLYVGGDFTSAGGQTRNHVAAIDVGTGLATAWDPNANGAVHALVSNGSVVYAGGTFTMIDGQTRNRIAALNSSTGHVTAWNPNAGSAVYALTVSGGTVYAGGAFTSMVGQTRNHAAGLNAGTGAITAWNPNADGNVLALAVNGTTIYAGGLFGTIGGSSRNRLAALSASTGGAGPWNPNPNGDVLALVLSGSKLYAGGRFSSVNGTPRSSIAAFDTSSDTANAWNPNANGYVHALAAAGVGAVYAGGSFNGLGQVARRNIAAIDINSGTARPWNPGANGTVRALALSGPTLYVGGDFTFIGGLTRNRIAALDTATASATAWNPGATGADSMVDAIATAGAVVYAGGAFTHVGGLTRSRIAAITTSGTVIGSWTPNANDMVRTLAASGRTIYAGGDFTSIGGQTRNRIAALDSTTGNAILSWDPNADQPVHALLLFAGTLYAGGRFTMIGAQPRGFIAALDTASGTATSWDPGANGAVLALAPAFTTMFAGGAFSAIGGETRNRLAELDRTTGLATAWDPDASDTVMTVVSALDLFAGGAFQTISRLPQTYLCALSISCPQATGVGSQTGIASGPQASVTCDLNQDEWPDIAIAVSTGAQLLENTFMSFTSFANISFSGDATGGRGIASADFDRDGLPDFAVTTGQHLYVMRSSRSSTYTLYDTYLSGTSTGIAIADINRDGFNDLAVVETGTPGYLTILTGNASGTFQLWTRIAVGSQPWMPVAADFNGDGFWDFGVTNSGSNNLSILLGRADGTYSVTTLPNLPQTLGNGPRSIAVGDFDRDGIADLAVGCTGEIDVLIGTHTFSGVGDGTFQLSQQIPLTGITAEGLAVCELNLERNADLAVGGSDHNLYYLYGEPTGVLGAPVRQTTSFSGAVPAIEANRFLPLSDVSPAVAVAPPQNQVVSMIGGCSTGISLQLAHPSAGEHFVVGQDVPVSVQWIPDDQVKAVHIEINRGTGRWERFAWNVIGTQFAWRVTGPAGAAQLRVVDANRMGITAASGPFTIDPIAAVPPAGATAGPSFSPPYPNPARIEVRLDLHLPQPAAVSVEVFDLGGRRVRTLARGTQAAGDHALFWDGRGARGMPVNDGIYFIRAWAGDYLAVRRVAWIGSR